MFESGILVIPKDDPSRVYLPYVTDPVRKFLTFMDRSVGYQLNKIKQNRGWSYRDPEGWQTAIADLKAQQKRCILMEDKDGRSYTYSGLAEDLSKVFGWTIDCQVELPEPKLIPWAETPKPPRYYQTEAAEALIASRHGSIELPTGSGKTLILAMLAKHFALKTIVMTPSCAITDSIYANFLRWFGPKYVGLFGGGKKKTDKLFTICTAQSLTRIQRDTKEWDSLSTAKVLISDESHTVPAETFMTVCLGVAKLAPYRFFLSATQTRADGSEMLLKGLTGPIVYSKDFRELVKEEFLAEPICKLFHVNMNPRCGDVSSDPAKETRNQLYLNPFVNQIAGQVTEKAVRIANRQVLILIDEFDQFLTLRNYLTIPFEFVHGPITKEAKDRLPQEYHNSDTDGAIDRFNKGECRVLIGTSVLGMGVDLIPVGCLIYLKGGASEVQTKQGLGRGTRICDGKKDFWFIDFNVKGSSTMNRHFYARADIYEELTDKITHYGRD